MYATTHFKPWPLTSACNWKNSSKWQNALAGLGPAESLVPAAVTVTTVALTSAPESVLSRHPGHPVSHLSPVCSGLERSCISLPPPFYFSKWEWIQSIDSRYQPIQNREAATWKGHGLSIGWWHWCQSSSESLGSGSIVTWASHLNFLYLSFLLCEMGMIIQQYRAHTVAMGMR